jgi:hypothetical protein
MLRLTLLISVSWLAGACVVLAQPAGNGLSRALSGTASNPAVTWASSPDYYRSTTAFEISRDREAESYNLNGSASGQAFTIEAPKGEHFGQIGFSINPSAQVSETGLGRVQETGAEVRLGQRLRQAIGEYQTGDKPSWFIFAGGGGQAITYTPGVSATTTPGGAIRLQDKVRVGRIQAGFAVEHHGFQGSLSYVRKEVSIVGGDAAQQHFAGLTLSYRK